MFSATDRLETARLVLALVLAASVGALASAFAGQYLFGLEPCILCLYQRVPYAAAAVIACVGLAGWARPWRSLSVALCAGVFGAGALLAFYHVGVEQHWWGSVTGCAGGPVSGLDPGDLRADALAEPLKPCDRVDWRLFGLSLAGYNTIFSTLLSLGCLASLSLIGRKPAP